MCWDVKKECLPAQFFNGFGAPDQKFSYDFRGSNSVVEFLPSKQGVAGSSPVSRSKITQL